MRPSQYRPLAFDPTAEHDFAGIKHRALPRCHASLRLVESNVDFRRIARRTMVAAAAWCFCRILTLGAPGRLRCRNRIQFTLLTSCWNAKAHRSFRGHPASSGSVAITYNARPLRFRSRAFWPTVKYHARMFADHASIGRDPVPRGFLPCEIPCSRKYDSITQRSPPIGYEQIASERSFSR